MHHPPLLPWHIDAPHQSAILGELALESGEAIHDYRQSFVTHGHLDVDRSNVILVCAAITGTHHRLDHLIGRGRALDPERWFIVATDPIGNGLSTSPSNSHAQPGAGFPRYTIRDMVGAQRRLLAEGLGIDRVAAVVGASMGGMQALQWAVSHPSVVGAVVALTAPARTSAWSIAVNEATRACLMADAAWNGAEFVARPERGWRAWTLVQRMLMSRSPDVVAALPPDPPAIIAAGNALVEATQASDFDALDFIYQSWAYDAHDVGCTAGFGGDTEAALASISSPALLLAPPLDLYNPAHDVRSTSRMIKNGTFVEIPSRHGHQSTANACAADSIFLNDEIDRFFRASHERFYRRAAAGSAASASR